MPHEVSLDTKTFDRAAFTMDFDLLLKIFNMRYAFTKVLMNHENSFFDLVTLVLNFDLFKNCEMGFIVSSNGNGANILQNRLLKIKSKIVTF
jgi:hypothetical protein